MARLLSVVVLFLVSQGAIGRDYTIEFDNMKPGVVKNPRGPINNDFTKGRNWGSVGWADGANFPNESDNTIYGVWLKVRHPEQDTFTAASTGGSAFPEAWRKKDGSELIFRGNQGIASGDYVWNRVPRTTDTGERNRFFGQLYGEAGKPEIPGTGDWEQISQPKGGEPDKSPNKTRKAPIKVPREIEDKVKMFEQTVNDSETSSEEVRQAVGKGVDFFGKPYFLGDADFGKAGSFTFWLYNPTDSSYRSYSVDVTQPPGQALMKTVLFAFTQKAQWVAVYPGSDNPNRPLYVVVYP